MVDEQESNPDSAKLDAFVYQAVDDWRSCKLRIPVRRLLEYADQLTRQPAECAESDLDELRTLGWSEQAIHDAVQVIGYFNYINRIADGLGVEPESDLPHWGNHT